MRKIYIIMSVASVALLSLLFFLTKNIVLSGSITLLLVSIYYLTVSLIQSRKRLLLLEKYCDPDIFLAITEKQLKMTVKKPKIYSGLLINKAAALYLKGDFLQAKEVLLSIDKTLLSDSDGSMLFYTVNLISCYYELGEISQGEEMYQREVPKLMPITRRMEFALELLAAERLYYINDLNESKVRLTKLLARKLSKRVHLSILYLLASIDEKNGDYKAAGMKFEQIYNGGNKLWIAVSSKNRLLQFSKQS